MKTRIDPETLQLLAESIERFRIERHSFEQRLRWLDGPDGFSRSLWADYGRMGWLALGLPTDEGGFDGDARPIAQLMDYVGAALALEPIFSCAVISARLLSHSLDDQARRLRGDLAAGRSIIAVAHDESIEESACGDVDTWIDAGRARGVKPLVLHGDCADWLIVSGRDRGGQLRLGVLKHNAPGVGIERYRLIDGRGAARVKLDDAPLDLLAFDDAQATLDQVLDEARLALCAEVLGAVRVLNQLTLAHLKTRQQFGRSLAANQVLQHRMVELHLLQQELRAVIEMGWSAVSAQAAQRGAAVSAACAVATTAARQSSHEAVQMHGGMGITAELPVSHYFKRLMVCTRLLGDRDQHLDRFATAGAAPGSPATS